MIRDKPGTLSEYVTELQSKGRVVFAAEEAVEILGTNRGAFLDAAQRIQKRGLLISPRKGFYVAVPPQFASWGAPPPSWYVDALMRREKQPYYVGLLKAAELHGATHQAVMEFQIVTGKRMSKTRAGRNLIVFYYRKDMASIAAGIEDVKTDTGLMKVSSPALTALDLMRYGKGTAGIDNVATVLSDFGAKIDDDQLAFLSLSFEKPVVQRLGYLLDILDSTLYKIVHVHTSTRPRPENFVCGDFVPCLLKGKNDSSEVPTISLLVATSDEGLWK